MDQKKNIYQKVIEVRKTVTGLSKDGQNREQRFDYTSSENTLAAIRPALDEWGVLIVPRIKEPRAQLIEKAKSGGGSQTIIFTELLLIYRIVNADDPNDAFEIEWYGQGIDYNGEKGVGKALTYAEKYLIMKLLNIPTGVDDPDAAGGNGQRAQAPGGQPPRNGGSSQGAPQGRQAPPPAKPQAPVKPNTRTQAPPPQGPRNSTGTDRQQGNGGQKPSPPAEPNRPVSDAGVSAVRDMFAALEEVLGTEQAKKEYEKIKHQFRGTNGKTLYSIKDATAGTGQAVYLALKHKVETAKAAKGVR